VQRKGVVLRRVVLRRVVLRRVVLRRVVLRRVVLNLPWKIGKCSMKGVPTGKVALAMTKQTVRGTAQCNLRHGTAHRGGTAMAA
jgi:hypothetical protein